jgi:hypothetical protein
MIIKFLLKAINITDVWNNNFVTQSNSSKNNPAQLGSASQPAQMNQAVINKNRIETIIHYLNFFGFNNVPKPNVFQTMTSPKNWSIMLNILYFFSNIVRVNIERIRI